MPVNFPYASSARSPREGNALREHFINTTAAMSQGHSDNAKGQDSVADDEFSRVKDSSPILPPPSLVNRIPVGNPLTTTVDTGLVRATLSRSDAPVRVEGDAWRGVVI